jgi:hypothetical protein
MGRRRILTIGALAGALTGALAGVLVSACTDTEAGEAELVCWTYVRAPKCIEAPEDVHTCCDPLSCYTWTSETPPVCDKITEHIYVCCGETGLRFLARRMADLDRQPPDNKEGGI